MTAVRRILTVCASAALLVFGLAAPTFADGTWPVNDGTWPVSDG